MPVRARISATEWETSLLPRDGGYVLPVKKAVRAAERIGDGATDGHGRRERRAARGSRRQRHGPGGLTPWRTTGGAPDPDRSAGSSSWSCGR